MIDLSAARETVRDLLMTDECDILRDPEGTTDDILDEATGELVAPIDDLNPVYSGICHVKTFSTKVQADASSMPFGDYVISIPYDADEVMEGDVVRIRVSQDDALIGMNFRVNRVIKKTIRVTRQLICEAPEDAATS